MLGRNPQINPIRSNQNIIVLSLCQALYMSVAAITITTSPLIGKMLASHESMATVPIAFLDVAILITAYFASIHMSKIGRKLGLMVGAGVGLLGGMISVASLYWQSFLFFCAGSMAIGCFFAYAQYYRFAAAELSSEKMQNQAISYVLAGGLVAAFLGPALTKFTRTSLSVEFAGNYLIVMLLCILSIGLLAKLSDLSNDHDNIDDKTSPSMSLIDLLANRLFLVAIIAAVVGYGVMTLLMTATPLAMQAHHHSFNHTADTIQWHLVGMFAPSFITGNLINRFGYFNIMLCGGVFLSLGSVIAINGLSSLNFMLALTMIGVGWNFLFIASSTILATKMRSKPMKVKAQGINETMVSGIMIVASLNAGILQGIYGWKVINYISIFMVAMAMSAILFFFLQYNRDQTINDKQQTASR